MARSSHAALVDALRRRFRVGHSREALDEDKLLAPCVEHLFGGETIKPKVFKLRRSREWTWRRVSLSGTSGVDFSDVLLITYSG